MNFQDFIEKNILKLQQDEITNITKHKIDYVSNYVDNWLYIIGSNQKCSIINFIDCMCNAGIYKDGTLTTSMRVLKLFVGHARVNPDKKYNLFLNDYDADRVDVILELSNIINDEKLSNMKVHTACMDVNSYFDFIKEKYSNYFNYGSNSILFVDPYNFGTVKIKRMKEFVEAHYSELIFNYFSSDYKRNIRNESALQKIERIKESMSGVPGYKEFMDEIEVMELIQNYLKESRLKYSFAYQFRNSRNVPLYSIIYATPHWRGLEEIKESFWKIFDGNLFYTNDDSNINQISLFDEKEINEESYLLEAQELVCRFFNNQKVSYDKILIFVLEHTMLRTGQLIRGVINPLIDDGKIIKQNVSGKRNYKNDLFYISEEK